MALVQWTPFIGLLMIACVAGSNTYVVLVPKTIRPGLTTNIQYNLRDASGDVTITTEILQGDATKFSSRRLYRAGETRMSALRIPTTLKAGMATIKVRAQGNITHTSSAAVKVETKSLSIFIQTDKSMYKPSQTVNFRAVIVDLRMMPYRGTCDIEIKDAENNKIKVWKSVVLENGVLTEKLELSDQPVLGDWKITVTTDRRQSQEKTITVAKYVLPKFEVSVTPPSFMLASESQVKVIIESKYTYGQGVDGTASLTITKLGQRYRYRRYQRQKLLYSNLELVDGKAEVTIPASSLKTLASGRIRNGLKFNFSAEVTEKLTGISGKEEAALQVYNDAEKIEFLASSPSNFKPGFTYTGFLKLSQVDGTVVPSPKSAGIKVNFYKLTELERLHCCHPEFRELEQSLYQYGNSVTKLMTKSYNIEYINATFSESGFAKFSFHVPDVTTSIKMKVKYGEKMHVTDSRTLEETKSPSRNFVQLVLLTNQLQAGSHAMFRMSSTVSNQMVNYQIWSLGSMVASGSVVVNSQLVFSVQMLPSMAPSARIIAYYIANDGELVVDSLNFKVEGALVRNQVTVSYSSNEAQPGNSIDVRVTAVTGSLVGLLAVDQSVLLLGGGNDISQSKVISELESYDSISDSPSTQPSPRHWYPWGGSESVGGTDSSTILSNSGLVALTNANVYRHVEREEELDCYTDDIRDEYIYDLLTRPRRRWHDVSRRCPLYRHRYGYHDYDSYSFFGRGDAPLMHMVPMVMDDMDDVQALPVRNMVQSRQSRVETGFTSRPIEKKSTEPRLRKVFPETWLWANMTSYNGEVSINTIVPDTITSWVASAFAVSPFAGLGVSSELAKIQVFKPFFVSLNLPYSVVRGEQLVLQAIVFNYMDRDMNVTVTLPASDEYQSIQVSSAGSATYIQQTDEVIISARANQGTTVSFPIVPTKIGKIRLRVRAVAANAADAIQRDLLVEAEGIQKEYNQAVLIDLKNSSSFTKAVAVELPPNTVNDSARVELTVIGDILGPSINGLERLIKMPYGCGEQNILNFAPTVFVTEYLTQTGQLTSELKSKSIGFMERGYQRELTYQRADGSFSAFGRSDPSGSMWLTAFVAKSFQQAKTFIFIDDNTIKNAVDWIVARQLQDGSFPEPGRIIHKEMLGGAASSKVTLTAFVLIAISEVELDPEASPRLELAKLNARSYLESHSSSLYDPYSLALTSYALFKSGSSNVTLTLERLESLAKVEEGETLCWEQPQSVPHVNERVWRPPHVQGKAVNIELAAYALQLKLEQSGLPAALPILKWLSAQRNANGGFSSTQDTVVGLQALAKFAKVADDDVNMVVSAGALGQTYNYSITSDNHLVLQSTLLASDVTSVGIHATGSGIALAQISVTYNVEEYEQEPAFNTTANILIEKDNSILLKVCTRWLLSGTTGMAVIEVGVPSGFSPDIEALEQRNYGGVKRVEEGDRKVILYLDEIDGSERCFDVGAKRTGLVAKARPVAVKVYDYYEPELQQTIFYSSTRLNKLNICDVCGATAACKGCESFNQTKLTS